MGKYTNLNVLSQNIEDKLVQEDSIDQVARMINQSGKNRSQRRSLARALNKTSNIMNQCQKRVDKSAYAEYQKATDSNFLHFFACLGLCMIDKYHWKETEDNEHGQITSLFERLGDTIDQYAAKGYKTEDLVKLLDEKTGIMLVPDSH